MNTFELFVRPLLDALLGRAERGPRRGRACLTETVSLKPDRRKFLRGRLHAVDGRLHVRLFGAQQSGILRSMVESDVLVHVPDGVERLEAGNPVDILFME
jgi:molybdopterin molybdotransferase